MYAVIIAGGQGTRLWPQSRKSKPKHLHPLVGSDTLIQKTAHRITPLIPEENIVIVTNQNHIAEIKKQLPTIKHIIAEPDSKNTAAAIGLAAIYLKKIIKNDEPVVVLPCDHLIIHEDKFLEILKHSAVILKKS